MNLNKECRQDSVNLNMNTNAEGNDVSHYSEIDKISPRGSNWSTWPEDLRNSSAAQTYVNVSSEESASSFVAPIPPPPPSIGPNTSPSKPKSNCELARSMNELSLNSNSSANVTKKLDPGFLAELEKHLGEKEATKNTNSASSEENQEGGANYLRCSSQDKLRQGSTSIQQLSTTVEDAAKSLSVIPVLKSPPHKKSKSPTMIDRRASFSSTPSTSKVQNSWQSKSTNIQRPRPQDEQRMSESTTDAIVSQIWQQTQTLSQQQQNICPTDLAAGCQTLTPVPVAQGNAKFQEAIGNIAISSANHDQHGPCNVAKAIFTQSQACSSNHNHSPNMTHGHINQGNINLLHETASNIAGSSMSETQHGPCNVAKATFNQAQVCSANTENYFQNPSSLGHGVSNLLQVVANSVTNDSQYDVTNTSKASLNQMQACSSTSSQNYNTSSVALSLLQTANHVSGASASEPSPYGSCNISKAASINQAQACPTMSQNYLQNQSSFALHQNCPQNASMSPGANNVHKIAHIQNDLQHLKPATLLSEQVYAELKQTVCNSFVII